MRQSDCKEAMHMREHTSTCLGLAYVRVLGLGFSVEGLDLQAKRDVLLYLCITINPKP